MSQATQAEQFAQLLAQYKPGTGKDRYARFAEDVLNLRVPEVQRQILGALEEHRRVCAVAANGVGKSYIAAAGAISALYTNAYTTVNITSGSYGQLDDTIWKPIKKLHRQSGLPGRTLDNTRELKSGFGEEWYLKCLSPRNPGDLEGRHNDRMVYVIEEADKPGITAEHIDSAASTITDEDDRMLVIANPPSDEANVVNQLLDSEKWHTLQFASWESHNVQHPEDRIPGLVEESEIRENWEEWNGEEWPGLEDAIAQTEERTDLDTRWYRRRAGRVPPESANTWRPWSISDVEQAWRRDAGQVRVTPEAFGLDVARSVDETVGIGLHGLEARVEYTSQDSHPVQRREVVELVGEWPTLPITVDAIGKGEPIAEELDSRYPDVRLFGNNQTAIDEKNYRYKWDEGLQLIGEWLRSGGSIDDQRLYEELKVAARVLQFEERTLASRGGKIIQATSKDELKDALGRSPDRLDALLMAVHAKETDRSKEKASPTFGW